MKKISNLLFSIILLSLIICGVCAGVLIEAQIQEKIGLKTTIEGAGKLKVPLSLAVIEELRELDADFDKIEDELEQMIDTAIEQEEVRVIVVLSEPYKEKQLSAMRKLNGKITHTYEYALNGFAGYVPLENVRKLRDSLGESLVIIERDKSIEMCLDKSVRIIRARNITWQEYGYKGDPSFSIAILDTGIDDSHPDLYGYQDRGWTSDAKIVGWVDVTADNEPSPVDYIGHGTHCSSIAAGTGDSYGNETITNITITFSSQYPSQVGSGWFDFVDVLDSGNFTVDMYHAPVPVARLGGPRVDKLCFKVVRSPDAQLVAMQTGETDVLTDLKRPDDVIALYNDGFTITGLPITILPGLFGPPTRGFHICYVGFNMRPDRPEVGPILSDVNFRHAIAHLVDKNLIESMFFGTLPDDTPFGIVEKLDTFVPPANEWYNPDVTIHDFFPGDPFTSLPGEHSSVGILKGAGYTFVDADGSGTVTDWDYWRDSTGTPLPKIEFLSPTFGTDPTSYYTVAMIVDNMATIGLQATSANGMRGVEHFPVDFNFLSERVLQDHDFDMAFSCWPGLGRDPIDKDPDFLYQFFHSGQDIIGGYNLPGISDPELDALLETIHSSLDRTEVETASDQAQVKLSELLPYVPIYSRNYYNAFHPELEGIIDSWGYGSDNDWTFLGMHWVTGTRPPDHIENLTIWTLQDDISRLNPLNVGSEYEWEIMDRVYDSLIAVEPYWHKDIPWVATNWTIESWMEGMNITFRLRDDVYWHDGVPLTAEDVKFNWEFIRDNQIPMYKSMWENLVNVEIPNPYVVSAYFNTTSQWMLYDLSDTALLLPPQVWTAWNEMPLNDILNRDPSSEAYSGDGPTPTQTNLFGTGPFIFSFYDEANWYGELTANTDYFGEFYQRAVIGLRYDNDTLLTPIDGNYNESDGIIGEYGIANPLWARYEITSPGIYKALSAQLDSRLTEKPFSTLETFSYQDVGDSYNLFTGVAPDSRLVGVKIFRNDGTGLTSDMLEAFDWVIANKRRYHIKVASMSAALAYGATDPVIRAAANNVVENGIVFVVAGGNNYPIFDIGDPSLASKVITVAATNENDQISAYSSNGPAGSEKPDVAAPGGSGLVGRKITAADTNDNDASVVGFADRNPDDYTNMVGTSMSTPHVAGQAALIIQALESTGYSWGYTEEDTLKVKMLILMTAVETNQIGEESNSPSLDRGGKDLVEGFGRVNVDGAIEAVTKEHTVGEIEIGSLGSTSLDKKAWSRKVNLETPAVYYQFILDVPSGADYDLYLYDSTPDGTGNPVILDKSVNASGIDESIIYSPASPQSAYIVVKWVSGSGTFALSSYPPSDTLHTLIITTTTGGTTDPTPRTYTYVEGIDVSVLAIPDVLYYLAYWELDGVSVGRDNPISVTMNTDHTLHALFRKESCPFVYVWNGTQYMVDNNLLPACEASDGANVEDYYRLEQTLIPQKGRYSLLISEFEQEHSYFDEVKLIAVDHRSDVHVAVSPTGEILTYTNPYEPVSAFDGKEESWLEALSEIDGQYYEGHEGDYLILDFRDLDVSHAAKLVLRTDLPPLMMKWSIHIQTQNPEGEWVTIIEVHPRVNWATQIVDLSDYLPDADGELKIRLYFTANHKIDYVGLDTSKQADMEVRYANLVSATHSKQGNVKLELLTSGGVYAELLPGEQIQLTFTLPTSKEDIRTFIFYVKGHYHTITNENLVATNRLIAVR